MFKLYHAYNNNYNNNYSFIICMCLQPFIKQCIYKLFFSHDYFAHNLFVSFSIDLHNGDLQTRNLS